MFKASVQPIVAPELDRFSVRQARLLHLSLLVFNAFSVGLGPLVMVAIALPSWMWFPVALVAIAMVFWVWFMIADGRHRRFRRELRSRPDRSACWHSEFPSDMPTVERVLTIFCDAFMFDEHHKYNFVPEDDVAIIYEKTTGPISDELQYEQLLLGIEEAFGVDLTQYNWQESLTLGDIVRTVIESKERSACGWSRDVP